MRWTSDGCCVCIGPGLVCAAATPARAYTWAHTQGLGCRAIVVLVAVPVGRVWAAALVLPPGAGGGDAGGNRVIGVGGSAVVPMRRTS